MGLGGQGFKVWGVRKVRAKHNRVQLSGLGFQGFGCRKHALMKSVFDLGFIQYALPLNPEPSTLNPNPRGFCTCTGYDRIYL